MKINVNEHGTIVLEEVFNPIKLKSADDETLIISMRDSGFEVIYEGHYYHLQKGQLYARGLIHAEEDLREFSNINYKNYVVESVDKFVKYLRHKQKKFLQSGCKVGQSGVQILSEFLINKTITQEMHDAILPAVEKYNEPYKINNES